MNILPCSSFNSNNEQDWSRIFNEKYPQAWSQTKDYHVCGKIDMAAIRSINVNEDVIEEHLDEKSFEYHNHFVGIYDCGKGRSKASLHLKSHLFGELSRLIRENDNHMSEDIIKRAFSSVEETFMQVVTDSFQNNNDFIEDGSCCILLVIWEGTLYIANLGDSRAVLGSEVGVSIFKRLHVEQLTNDHSLSNEAIREDLKAMNPHDPDVVMHTGGIWQNRRNIEVSRSIGYAHLKDHSMSNLLSTSRSSHLVSGIEGRTEVLVSAEPELHSRKIRKSDRFLILASHGFWNFMTNKNAANIVNRNPPDEIAKRLLSAALEKASEKGGEEGVYDDMFIIVLLFRKRSKWWNDTPETVVVHEGPSYLRNIIMASGKSGQSHQSLTSSIPDPQASVPTHTLKVDSSIERGSSSSSHQLLLKDTSQMDQLMAISENTFEIKKMLQEMQNELKSVLQQQQLLQHQPLPPMSVIQELEMIGKALKLAKGLLPVEMEKSIFGDQAKQEAYIDGDLMIEVAKQERISDTSMAFYVRYLHDEIIRPNELFNKFSFLSPHIMSAFVSRSNEELVEVEKKSIVTVFLECQKFKDKLILAPCNLGRHWVLIVINVNVDADTIYYIDSLQTEPTNYPNLGENFQKTFEEYHKESGVVSKSEKIKWIFPKCPKQRNHTDCGYYVMKFMKEIIMKSPNEIPVNYFPKIEGDTYSNEDLDEVKKDWASYMIHIIKTTKSPTAV